MDKKTYLEIRRKLNLQRQESMIWKHLALDALLIAGCFALGAVGAFRAAGFQYLMIPLISILMFRNFGLMHEASHNLISKNRSWNDFCGTVSGGLALLAYEPWKRTHIEHHYWSGNVEKDPVMALIPLFPRFPQWLQKSINLTWQAWIPLLAVLQHVVFWTHSFRHALKDPRDFKIVSSLLVPVLVWGAILTLTPSGFNYLILAPAMLLYLSAVEIVNLPHHLELPQASGDHKYPVWEQHYTARSCLYPQWLSRLVVLNFNYHIEHHMFTDAPWYTLPAIRQEIKPVLKSEYNEDAQFAWTAQNRKRELGEILAKSRQNRAPEASDSENPPVAV